MFGFTEYVRQFSLIGSLSGPFYFGRSDYTLPLRRLLVCHKIIGVTWDDGKDKSVENFSFIHAVVSPIITAGNFNFQI